MAETSRTRPKNVVILDAENPLVEVRGEFYWREDHEHLLAVARDQAFCDGFAEGYAAGQDALRSRIVMRRTSYRRRLLARLVVALLALSFFLSVVLTAVEAVTSGH